MTWGAVAVAGATVVSGVMASNSADRQSKAASQASKDQLGFERQRYEDWQNVYGHLQDTLSEYYQSVTPDYYATIGLENFQQQYQTGLQRLNESLVQRGIDPSSGIAASLTAQAELSAAEQRANIRRDAERQSVEDRTRFLQIGLGQNPANSVANALSQQAQQAQSQSIAAQQSAGQAWAAAIPAAGKAITSIYDNYNTPQQST